MTTITLEQLIELRLAASLRGDRVLVALCDEALDGDEDAWHWCACTAAAENERTGS